MDKFGKNPQSFDVLKYYPTYLHYGTNLYKVKYITESEKHGEPRNQVPEEGSESEEG